MAVNEQQPIGLLAPTCVVGDPDSTVIVEMTRNAFHGLAAAVEVAFGDPDSVPTEYKDIAAAWWTFTNPQADPA